MNEQEREKTAVLLVVLGLMKRFDITVEDLKFFYKDLEVWFDTAIEGVKKRQKRCRENTK